MKLKLRVVSFAIALGLSLAMTNLPLNSWLSWRIGTIKNDLWEITQKFNPDFESEKIATSAEPTLMSSIFPTRNDSDKSMENNDFFPLGWYDSVNNLATPAQIATEGIDLIVPYTGKSDLNEVRAYLDRAAAVGIKVMVEIPRLEVRRDHRWLITQLVKALKNHPAVYGWYLFDEPEFIQMSPAILKRVYDAIKLEDPNHTVAIAFGKLDRAEEYLQALDTLIYFRYPCYYDSPEFCGFEDGSFRDLAAEAGAISQQGNFWMALQGYGEDKYGKPTQFNRRLPSLEEERYMIYSAVLAHANGLLFWAHYRSQQQWIDRVLTPLIEELREYLPAITNFNSVVPRVASDVRVQTKLFRDPQTGDLLLIAINHSGQSFTTEMEFQPRVRINSIRTAAENSTVVLEQGVLTDIFEPFAVHIYQLESN